MGNMATLSGEEVSLNTAVLPRHPFDALTPSTVAPAPTVDAPVALVAAKRRRLRLGIGIVVIVLLLHAGGQLCYGQEPIRVTTNLAFLAVEMPAIMWALSRTYDWSIKRRWSSVGSLLAGVAVAGVLGASFGVAFWILVQQFPVVRAHTAPTMARAALHAFCYAQLYFGLWTLGFVYPFAFEDARVRALEADRLRSAAELARLRSHLEPHFLLNTLNAIAGLVTEEPKEARRLLACLGDLLRDALQADDEPQTLDEQIAWLQRYAAILKARHPDSLQFDWDVTPGAGAALVPRLLLQPLVENAVKHGALRRREGGEVVVRVRPEAGRVVCIIEDNGPGMSDAEMRAGAFGLHAVRRRLELWNKGAKLRLESSSSGTRSIVELPQTAGRSKNGGGA
jgi:signal transduction histidine kinase